MKRIFLHLFPVVLGLGACTKKAESNAVARSTGSAVPSAQDDTSSPAIGSKSAPPAETEEPNVPEFEPAFAGQTRARAVQTRTHIKVTEVAGDFEKPWAIAFLPDRRMLVTEKLKGKLFIVAADGTRSPAVAGVPKVDGRNQGGLLDVALSPDYESSRLVYWTYYEPREGGNGLAVARGRLLDTNPPKLEAVEVIFRMQPTLDSTKHAGGRLVFTPDNRIFVTLGERSVMEGRVQARDLGSHFGKIVRINRDGSVPPDNPFVATPGALPAIWSLGHRNVLGAALDEQNRLWVAEMGPRGGDELNLVLRGRDYGWPKIGYGEEYSGEPIHEKTQAPGLEQPVYYWDPVISPSSLLIYSGRLFTEWKGNFLIGALSRECLVRLVLRDDRVIGEERLLTDRDERIREVVEDRDGALWLLTDEHDGKLLKLTPG